MPAPERTREHPNAPRGTREHPSAPGSTSTRLFLLERIGEAAVVQLYADGFERLSVRDRILCWHLYQAALAGRDIYYDQRYAHNLEMRAVLEAVLRHPAGVEPHTLAAIARYTKLFWINTGPFNNLTARKFVPAFTPEALAAAVASAVADGARLPLGRARRRPTCWRACTARSSTASSRPSSRARRQGAGRDILQASANNLYVGVSMADVDGFDERYPLNSRLVRQAGTLVEEVYRVGGRYASEIGRIVETPRGGDPVRAPRRWRARWRRSSSSTRPARRAPGARTTSPGWPMSSRTWTRSTGSSRSTWTRAA